jgi:aminopeptidase
VAEQFLDRPEVRAALEQVRCEGVAQPVRMRSDPSEGARVEATAVRREEERVLSTPGELWPCVVEVPRGPPRGLLSERDDALLAALAAHADVLLLEVDVGQVESDGLGASKAGGVDELDEGSVPERERAVAVERPERRVHLLRTRRVRKPPRASKRQCRVGNPCSAEREAQERPDRGDLARDRRGRKLRPPASQFGCVLGQLPHADFVDSDLALLEPARELLEIDAVRAARGVSQRRAEEEAVDRACAVHRSLDFAPAVRSPAVDSRVERLAELAVRFGANVQPGQVVLVAGEPEQLELLRAIAEEAYRAGAKFVDVSLFDPYVKRSRLRHAPEDTLDWVPSWYGARQLGVGELRGARIAVAGNTAPHLFDDVDASRAGKDLLPTTAESLKVTNDRTTNWSVVPGPCEGWAAVVHPDVEPKEALERLWGEIEHILRLDEPDPVAAWEERVTTLKGRAEQLNGLELDALRFEGPGTDLTVGLFPSSLWWAADFTTVDGLRHMPNLPTEEMFTMPDPERTEGHVTSTKPLLLAGGGIVEGLRVRFEAGRAVQIDAEVGADLARATAQTDDGASRLGEVALVDGDSRIGKLGTVFHTTLIDENAVSHVALGGAYPFSAADERDVARMNESRIHVDFMIGGDEVEVTGVARGGEQVPLLRGGDWRF